MWKAIPISFKSSNASWIPACDVLSEYSGLILLQRENLVGALAFPPWACDGKAEVSADRLHIMCNNCIVGIPCSGSHSSKLGHLAQNSSKVVQASQEIVRGHETHFSGVVSALSSGENANHIHISLSLTLLSLSRLMKCVHCRCWVCPRLMQVGVFFGYFEELLATSFIVLRKDPLAFGYHEV